MQDEQSALEKSNDREIMTGFSGICELKLTFNTGVYRKVLTDLALAIIIYITQKTGWSNVRQLLKLLAGKSSEKWE